jgi:N-acetylmuramoyl-L-alanine amidase
VVLVSVHVDAAGSDGQWLTATGWSYYTSPGQTAGDRLAECLYRAAEKHLQGHKIRTDYSVGDPDKEAGFYILKRTKCPAALVECGFMDNKESLHFLVSPDGRKAIKSVIIDGIFDYLRLFPN